MSEIKQMIRKLREGTMGLPSGLELEAAELLERLMAEPVNARYSDTALQQIGQPTASERKRLAALQGK